jgi:DNA-binding XRE family transcriptional regulator
MTAAEYKAHREKLGLTQAGLAARLEVTRKTINARENGGTRITEEAALAISSLLSSPK